VKTKFNNYNGIDFIIVKAKSERQILEETYFDEDESQRGR